VGGAFERARRLLERHRRVLESGAEQLLIHETLDRQELEALRARLNAAEDAAVTPVPAKGKASPAAAVP
jgi:ATP-dependent Zn protease